MGGRGAAAIALTRPFYPNLKQGERTMYRKKKVTSGIRPLDDLLGGLFIGDNVVWHDDAGSLALVFCMNFLHASQTEGKPIIYVSFDRSPKTVLERLGPLADYPGLTVMDCFTEGKGDSSPVFLRFYEEDGPARACRVIKVDQPRDADRVTEVLNSVQVDLEGDVRLLFESLTGMEELWGGEDQLISFYSHTCPRLYDMETVAYWIMEKDAHTPRLRAQISQIAQVIVDLSIKRGTTSLTILKAENRQIENLQKAYQYWSRELIVTFEDDRRTAGGLDLGQRLKELRTRKGISQTELARVVGVTPSTISQVESNLIYPSLPALLKMAETLAVDVSSFFKAWAFPRPTPVFAGSDAIPLKLAGLSEESIRAFRLSPIDLDRKLEPYLIEISPGKTLPSHFFFYKGEEFGYVISGQLDLKMTQGAFTVGPGDVIYLTSEAPTQWKNTGSDYAKMLWIKVK